VRFLAAWAVPFWIALELVPTKLPHYLLPAFPALALMAGRAAVAGDGVPRWAWRVGAALWAAASLAVAATLVGAPAELEGGVDFAGLVAALVVVIYGTATLHRAWRAPGAALVLRAVALAVVVVPAALAIEAPRLGPLWLSRAAAALAARTAPGAPVVAVGYAEPSLVFLLGSGTLLASPDAAAARLRSGNWVALVESRAAASFATALGARGLAAEPLGRVAGLDYSNGKRMVLTLERAVPVTGAR
jgi:4-amino-4-deoxy-L-arabinose transferase-like glycosyltransferase